MYDQIEICVRNLKALNTDIATSGVMLVPFLNGKLPSEIRVILSRNFQNDIWQLDDTLKILKREVEAKERSFSIGTSSEFEPEKRDRHYTTSAFLNSSLERKCPFCNLNNHPASKCLKVTNMAARKQILRQKGLCFICFNSEHLAKMCKSSYKCRKYNGKHHISICTFEKRDDSAKTESQNDTEETITNFSNNKNTILLQTSSAVVSNLNSSERKTTLLLLDSGSQRSYILEKLRNELNLPTLRRERLFIKTFGKCKGVDVVSLNVITSNKTITIEAICTPDICDPLANRNVKAVSTNHNHLKNLKLPDSSNNDTKSVNILIGLDYYYLFVTGDIIRREPNEPIALNSIFGCILCGTFVETTQANLNVTHLFHVNTLGNKTGGITEEGNPFEFDITYDTRVQMFPKEDHKHIFEDFEKNIQFKNNRYITKLPIRKTDDMLPDNYILANNRLINLEEQLDRNKKRFVDYDKMIQDYLKEGIVEQIDHFDNNTILGRVHYLPHRGVVREDYDTTKLCIVFDASAKIRNELSLNDILYSGPCLLPYLYDILLRFRTGKIGLVGDIKQAFLQVEIAEEHSDFVRFLWFKDINETPRKIISLRFTHVVFGLTSSPFLLNGK